LLLKKNVLLTSFGNTNHQFQILLQLELISETLVSQVPKVKLSHHVKLIFAKDQLSVLEIKFQEPSLTSIAWVGLLSKTIFSIDFFQFTDVLSYFAK
jgi:hypothetical protein